MKRILAILLAVSALGLVMAGCSSGDSGDTGATAGATAGDAGGDAK
jgi:hypothetical protein